MQPKECFYSLVDMLWDLPLIRIIELKDGWIRELKRNNYPTASIHACTVFIDLIIRKKRESEVTICQHQQC